MTERSEQTIPWNVYPRPKCRRASFFCLNGTWDFCVCAQEQPPTDYSERILVPFCPQSTRSGIGRRIEDGAYLFYRRRFALPQGFVRDRVLLHFGACDQITKVYVNGALVGENVGGYGRFSFDITDRLCAENEIVVCAVDRLDTGVLPYGKQKHKRGGMWYTPVSGIWQTVWIESVPQTYVRSVSSVYRDGVVTILADGVDEGEVIVRETGDRIPLRGGRAVYAPTAPHLWSPDDPYLYHIEVRCGADVVESYFTLRTVEIAKVDGIPRILVNGAAVFFNGLLDQGYYKDGIFTPNEPQDIDRDILFAKKLGFNTLRKHIKIEPDLFYYACDRLGMFVFQDMVNNGRYSFLGDTLLPTLGLRRRNDVRRHRDPATRRAFIRGCEETVAMLGDYGCIVYWTIFNEGWGQFSGSEMYEHLKRLDDTRPIDTASGWFCGVKTDVESRHVYFRPPKPVRSDKPLVLTEFGGYAHRADAPKVQGERSYGYGAYRDRAAYGEALLALYRDHVIPMIREGLCGAIYTQLSDVEDEINGLITYDRAVEKVDHEPLRRLFATIKI